MLKTHMNFLIYKFFFAVCLTTEDIDIFGCDPREFMHHQKSPLAKFCNPWMTAITLITDLVNHCGKDNIQGLFGNLMEILSLYE